MRRSPTERQRERLLEDIQEQGDILHRRADEFGDSKTDAVPVLVCIQRHLDLQAIVRLYRRPASAVFSPDANEVRAGLEQLAHGTTEQEALMETGLRMLDPGRVSGKRGILMMQIACECGQHFRMDSRTPMACPCGREYQAIPAVYVRAKKA